MRELKQDWRDVFGSFRVAFDVWKLALAFAGVVITLLVLWGLDSIPSEQSGETVKALAGWLIPVIVSALLLAAMVFKFLNSDTGLTTSKILMLVVAALLMAGLVALCLFTETANVWGAFAGKWFVVLMIWAFFGGAITRIAAVEIANDDRIGLGEAGKFACRKYGACLGATVLPAVAVLVLALGCVLFGLLVHVPYLNFFVTLVFFFLIPLAGFLMFLIGLGGLVGSPLMYPAVSCEANDSFDAISRAYSYVFGRPWRYVFFNVAGALYGLTCAFFVAFFVRYMLGWSFASVNYGADGWFNETILPACKQFVRPLNNAIFELVDWLGRHVANWDVTGYINRVFDVARTQLAIGKIDEQSIDLDWYNYGVALIIAIVVYVIVGMVIAYVVSLFFSIQTTIYLLLRKSVDGAEMTEVYREEEESALAVAPAPEPAADASGEKKE